ncbi:MAG: ZIP family metal transporter [Candidatus Nanohaloarchaea archaeon]|nr:ZIP family metal transporter [Candidatus Nanohaloarchaea archaeon]
MPSTVLYIVASILLASLLSMSGALFLLYSREHLDTIKQYLVSLAIGALFGGALIHLLPRYAAQFGVTHLTGLVIVMAVFGSYLLERGFHWHCHGECGVETYSYMLIAGDLIHNLIDGIIVAGSYFVSLPTGIAATVAIMVHKVPKEIGDFGVLLHSGMDEWRAVGINAGTNAAALAGAFAVILLSNTEPLIRFLIPVAIGNFLYVAGTDLLPESAKGEGSVVLHALLLLFGILLMYGITFLPLAG